MVNIASHWQVAPAVEVPSWFLEAVGAYIAHSSGKYAAQLLWQRGIQSLEQLAGFIDTESYTSASAFDFGIEMQWAVQRLEKGRIAGDRVLIWGDFDADGITSTSVLWEGLGQFFTAHEQLRYYIPNRLTESHGLNLAGIARFAEAGIDIIVTCDTGSTNLEEINAAKKYGIDIIVTDHHTVPLERPDVVAIINPRYLPEDHPLYHLSGVAVAYKLVEALYQHLPEVPQHPLENLLDLVAIGLIADLVELKGDCRYLAQRGIEQLQKQSQNPTRPGVAKLLALCNCTGDRPTDISFGLGPRINAISRIQGDATFGVELLTSRDESRCEILAAETELANTRRKAIQKDVVASVKEKIALLDLSTTSVIVLEDPQWPGGVLGLVAGQIAQEYGRPTILLSTAIANEEQPMARGSARSVNEIDLYQLVRSQSSLLHRFGGHPYAAGLSLPVENLPLFRQGINQHLRQQLAIEDTVPIVTADLVVTVAELGQPLFRELKLLEPCGMGNPVPKLLVKNCWFRNRWHKNERDTKGKPVQYIKTTFNLGDESDRQGFPGIWWGHYKDELPQEEPCDAIVELDYNTYHKRYEVRLIDVRPARAIATATTERNWLLDWRGQPDIESEDTPIIRLDDCPRDWDEFSRELRAAIAHSASLALAYPPPEEIPSEQVWETLIGIAKYLSRTQETVSMAKVSDRLEIGKFALSLGIDALVALGFECLREPGLSFQPPKSHPSADVNEKINAFLNAVEEEQFRRQYFYQIPITTLASTLDCPSNMAKGNQGDRQLKAGLGLPE